jgi:hypothetical protein
MKEQLPLKDLAKTGWKTFEEEESIVLYSDRTTRAGNYHYDRRGAIESSLCGYVKIGKDEENSNVEAFLFGIKNGESEIEKAWEFPLDFFKLDELLFGKFPAYLFGATNIKEIRNISKKYST